MVILGWNPGPGMNRPVSAAVSRKKAKEGTMHRINGAAGFGTFSSSRKRYFFVNWFLGSMEERYHRMTMEVWFWVNSCWIDEYITLGLDLTSVNSLHVLESQCLAWQYDSATFLRKPTKHFPTGYIRYSTSIIRDRLVGHTRYWVIFII
jgi:hypothetical protein